jgi:hypothetical protein
MFLLFIFINSFNQFFLSILSINYHKYSPRACRLLQRTVTKYEEEEQQQMKERQLRNARVDAVYNDAIDVIERLTAMDDFEYTSEQLWAKSNDVFLFI